MFKKCICLLTIIMMAAPAALSQSNSAASQDAAIKAAIMREITDYLEQFKAACFAETISIGNPDFFQKAMNQNIHRIIIGKEGAALIATEAPNAKSYHSSWRVIGRTADLVFPFDPRKIPAGAAGHADRQRLVHEFTHHIEFINWVKQPSRTITGRENPPSERNTDFQDGVVDRLRALVMVESLDKRDMGKLLVNWQPIQSKLRELEKGPSAGMTRPDENLEAMTGFRANLDRIEQRYLSKGCGPDLRNMVLLSRELPNISNGLEITRKPTGKTGNGETVKAVLIDMNKQDMTGLEDLNLRYVWTLPNKKVMTGNPVVIPPSRDGGEVIVNLLIKFEGQEYLLAEASFLQNAADESPAANNSGGKYQGRLSGDLQGSFEFTVIKTDRGDSLINGRLKSGSVEREIVGVLFKSGKFSADLTDKALGPGYQNYTRGTFSGEISGKNASGTWDTYDSYRPGMESAHWKGDWQTGGAKETTDTANWTGNWQSTWGTMSLVQSGNAVTGTYEHDNGRVKGTIVGNMFRGTWSEGPTYSAPNDAGEFEFTLLPDGTGFTGRWRYGSNGAWQQKLWTGTRP